MNYFIKRTLAYFIDCIIAFAAVMLIIQWAILSQFRESLGITDLWFQSSLHMQYYVLTTISFPVWFYFAFFDSNKSNGTIGKRIFKLEVTDNNKRKIGFWKSVFRTILKLLPWEIAHVGIIFPTPLYYDNEPEIRILIYIGIILFAVYVISIWTNSRNQSVYDKMLGTIVSQKKQLNSTMAMSNSEKF